MTSARRPATDFAPDTDTDARFGPPTQSSPDTDADARVDRRPQHVFARREHFARTTSTNDVIRQWLAEGEPEVCIATADEQTHGRGREGRSWQAVPGSSLLLSLGFRPTWLPPDRLWQLAAVVAMSMADASEAVAGLADGVVRLKWPNDLVIEFDDAPGTPRAPEPTTEAATPNASVRKLAGVLGETVGLGTSRPTAIIGIGINVDWQRDDFPTDLAAAMTSLSDASGRRQGRDDLLGAFLSELEHGIDDLRDGRFDDHRWQHRQVTTGRSIDLIYPDDRRTTVMALGVDPRSGGLIVDDEGRSRVVHSAEILHVRLSAQGLPTEVGV